jgi:hypothetical protein
MRKIFCLVIALLIASPIIYAQGPKIEKSEAFDEPGDGWNKVMMMKNGNTFFFHFSKRDGIEINVFDKSRKTVATKEIKSELWETRKMKNTLIAGLYEINNEAVLFMVQSEGRVPTLYRVRFNSTTGDMVKEEEIGTLAKTKLVSFGGEINTVYIEKDPESDCYAVIFFNNYAGDPDERIKVLHLDGNHKVLNTAFYESPNEDFKYLRYIGAVVDGNRRLFLSVYGAASMKGKEGKVYISGLKAGNPAFINKPLNFTEDFKDTKSVMTYNHNNNTLQLLTLSFAKGRLSFFGDRATGSYMAFMSYIDPESLDLKSVKPIAGAKINEYAHDVLNTDLNYRGLPQQMIINKDNSTTILSEEQTQEITVDQNGNVVSSMTYLGGIGVNELNADGTEKSGYAIRKLQAAAGLIDPLYISSRSKGRWNYVKGFADHNSYMSFDYINTDKNRYIIFNDNNKNFDKDEDQKKRKIVTNVNKLNTICYSLNGSGVNKSYLFGDTGDNDKSNSCHIEASDFDQATGTYATIMIERDGRDRQAKMVWVKFE